MPATLSLSAMAVFYPHLVPKGHSMNKNGIEILSNKHGLVPISDLLLGAHHWNACESTTS